MSETDSVIYSGFFRCKGLSFLRAHDDHNDIIDAAIKDFWRNPPQQLTHRTYEHEGHTIHVHIDWRPFLRNLNRLATLFDTSQENNKYSSAEKWLKKVISPVKFKSSVSIKDKIRDNQLRVQPHFFLEMFIHEVFLIANLSVPGSVSFRGSVDQGRFSSEITLDGSVFELAWMHALDGRWPANEALSRQDVLGWFKSLNLSCKQLPESGIEKALYALLHIAKNDQQIESIVWIFHGLEGLVSSNPGGNFSAMIRRLSAILDLKSSQQKILKKRLTEMYQMRSAFVHGGYAVPHPLCNEVVDKRLDDQLGKLYGLITFGVALLVATLQVLIKKQIVKLQFEERILTTTT